MYFCHSRIELGTAEPQLVFIDIPTKVYSAAADKLLSVTLQQSGGREGGMTGWRKSEIIVL